MSRVLLTPDHRQVLDLLAPGQPVPGIEEIANDPVFEDQEGIGWMLEFDRDDIPIRRGWFGPTESVVDDLAPWLVRYQSRQLVADHASGSCGRPGPQPGAEGSQDLDLVRPR